MSEYAAHGTDRRVTITTADLAHLRRCVELAGEALSTGNDPFGSVLVDGRGHVLAEEHNLEHTASDPTAHPEIALCRWAAVNLPVSERATATLYTSGEHCPMCAAAQAMVGVGRAVYVASSDQLAAWRQEWGMPPSPIRRLGLTEVASDIEVAGPAPDLIDAIRALHQESARRRRR